MKQGTVITRIMIVLLFFMVCAYLIFSAIRTLDERSYTVTTYSHTLDDAAETTGLLIRAEKVPAQGAYTVVVSRAAALWRAWIWVWRAVMAAVSSSTPASLA